MIIGVNRKILRTKLTVFAFIYLSFYSKCSANKYLPLPSYLLFCKRLLCQINSVYLYFSKLQNLDNIEIKTHVNIKYKLFE